MNRKSQNYQLQVESLIHSEELIKYLQNKTINNKDFIYSKF